MLACNDPGIEEVGLMYSGTFSRVILMCVIALLCLTAAPLWASNLVYSFNMDSDPGWTAEGDWGYGSASNCCVDYAPTGSNVYGTALGTEYTAPTGMQYLTTTALDCSALSTVYLRFWRWLGVADDTLATVEVSNDSGATWTTVWQTDGVNWFQEDDWTECTYNISSVAAGESTVYVRWGMRADSTCSCFGWTLDDVQIWDGTPPATVSEQTIYRFPFDADPGWTTEGQWEFGIPQGSGGDPASSYSGSYVYGYNLAGTYIDNMPAYSLTTQALNCMGFKGVWLRFQRWLGVESNSYDHASVQVSSNGTDWTTVWSNGSSSMQDTAWTPVEYDISAIADGQPTVYIRWVMGTTDGSVIYSGWNIDDVEIAGTPATEILAWVAYADLSTEYPNSLTALASQYPYFNVTSTDTLDPATLAAQLAGKHVFLMPEPENATSADLGTAGTAFSDVLRNFVDGGGTVIVAGEWPNSYEGFLSATGLLESDAVTGYWSGESLTVVEPTHPLAAGLSATVTAQDATGAYSVGPEATVVVEDGLGNAVVAARQIGAGAVVVLGYDYYAYDDNAAIILANAVQYPRHSQSVLLYESSPVLRVGMEALSRLNHVPWTAVDGNFNTTLGFVDWNLVVADAPSSSPSEAGGWQPFADWITAGGHGLVSTWDLDTQTALTSAMGVTATPSLDGVPSMFDWDTDIPLFDFRESVPTSLTDWSDLYWTANANQLTPVAPDAIALAGFASSPTAGEAAIVAGNNYSTLLNGFLWDDRNQDADGDGVQDVVELVMNQIEMLLTVPFPDFSASVTECVTSDVVSFSDESGANVTGWNWNFGDSTSAATQNPTHSYTNAGIYDVSMRAFNQNGFDTEVKRDYMWVGFPDVLPSSWAFHEVVECVDAGVVQGYDSVTYAPAVVVNRAQMATYMARALAGGDANVPAGPGTASFADVPTDYWAFKYVEYAVANDVVQGYEDGTYLPEVELDRGQMSVFIARAVAGDEASVPAGPATPTFPDVASDFWAYKHIEFCKAQGIVGGYPDGNYWPGEMVTRDQMAVYVARALPLL